MSVRAQQTRRWREESGQDVLEWSGLLVLVSAMFTLMFALGMPGKVARAVTCAIDQIVRAGLCTSGPAYPVSVTTRTVGYQGRVTFVDAGHQYVVTLTDLSNGTAQISLSDTGSLGLSARAGAEVELGPLGSAEAQAQAGGGVYVNGSTTWTFPSWSAAQKYWKQVSSGNSAGLAVNDAANSVPLLGHALGGLVDKVTGAQGAPTVNSIPHRYLSATAVGGGAQGNAGAGAGVDAGPIDADIKASVSAQAGLERINSGSQKGDWQGTVQLSVEGDGSLGEALFGAHTSGVGSLDGAATVTFGPDFTPQTLEITASGDGVWDAAPSSSEVPDFSQKLPPGSEASGGGAGGGGESGGPGGSGESGSGGAEGAKQEAPLEVSHSSAGGAGVGTAYVGTLNLAEDPAAQAALAQVLQGNTAGIPVLINDMNTEGTEYIQSYRLAKSTSTWGGQANLGGGGGLELGDGTSSACYGAPKVHRGRGPWVTATFNAPSC